MRQKDQLELNLGTEAKGEAPSAAAQAIEARATKACLERPVVAGPSMEAVIERKNLKQALAQVRRNKGAAGIDSMSVDHLPAYLKEHWPTIRAQLLEEPTSRSRCGALRYQRHQAAYGRLASPRCSTASSNKR